jgi:thiol-disulfide isomerase/thioredoxin
MLLKNKNINKNIYDFNINGVVELKLKDFKYHNNKLYIKNKYFKEKNGFILFYVPWCKFCKKFSELYTELALSNINLFYFGAVNCDDVNNKNDKLCNYENILKYPTLKYINKDGSLTNYEHEYNIDNLIYFINTKINESNIF